MSTPSATPPSKPSKAPLENARICIAGTAATAKDMKEGATYDLLIPGVGALILIFVVMLVLTRAVIAAAVIVGTVLLSLGTSFGLSVLIWQYILGLQLHWMILAMSVIILLAVGSDYNLLLVSRFKEEITPASRPASSDRWPAPAPSSPPPAWCSRSPGSPSALAPWSSWPRSAAPSEWAYCSTPWSCAPS